MTAAAARPNVLLVTVDQWPGGLLGCAGHPVIQTPTIDQLARNGVRHTRAYSESPICIPARRTLLTGTDTRTHGDRVFNTVAPWPHGLTSLPQAFRDAGHQAHAVGKLHVYPPRDRIGSDDVQLAKEGRPHPGAIDDYEMFLADRGFPGQQFADRENAPLAYRTSVDDGHTWSAPTFIRPVNDPGFRGMAVMRMTETARGTWLLGAHTAVGTVDPAYWGHDTIATRQYLLRSEDCGASWTLRPGARPGGWFAPGYDRMDEGRPLVVLHPRRPDHPASPGSHSRAGISCRRNAPRRWLRHSRHFAPDACRRIRHRVGRWQQATAGTIAIGAQGRSGRSRRQTNRLPRHRHHCW